MEVECMFSTLKKILKTCPPSHQVENTKKLQNINVGNAVILKLKQLLSLNRNEDHERTMCHYLSTVSSTIFSWDLTIVMLVEHQQQTINSLY
jgi:hypothetical protein